MFSIRSSDLSYQIMIIELIFSCYLGSYLNKGLQELDLLSLGDWNEWEDGGEVFFIFDLFPLNNQM